MKYTFEKIFCGVHLRKLFGELFKKVFVSKKQILNMFILSKHK
jgi:hypothetical protein